MPEIHLINGKPRECSDAVRARGLIDEWLKNPDATEKKIEKILEAEATERAKDPRPPTKQEVQQTASLAMNQVAKQAATTSGSTKPPKGEE